MLSMARERSDNYYCKGEGEESQTTGLQKEVGTETEAKTEVGTNFREQD